MLASIFSLNVLQTALELGCIYGLVALALFLSYSILNIADLSTDGCFTLGAAVGAVVAISGHPLLALPAAFGLLHIREQEDQNDPKPPKGEYSNQQPRLPRPAHQSHDGDNSTNQNGDAADQKSFVVTHFFAVLPVNFA